MKINVLLVDDQYIDIQCLKEIVPWGDFDMEVVAHATKGFDALEIIKNQKIDLLVSDIEMPVMSGLEVLKLAQEFSPQLETVFISGHQQFSYAKKAINMGASAYILKPIDIDEICLTLKKIGERIKSRKEQNNTNENPVSPISKKEFIENLLTNNLNETSMIKGISEFNIDILSGFRIMLVRLPKQQSGENISLQNRKSQIYNLLKQCSVNLFTLLSNTIVVVFSGSIHNIDSKIYLFKQHLNKNNLGHVECYLGEYVDSIDRISASYKNCQEKYKSQMLGAANTINKKSLAKISHILHDIEGRLSKNDYEIESGIDLLIDYIKKNCSASELKEVYIHILFEIEKIRQKLIPGSEIHNIESQINKIISCTNNEVYKMISQAVNSLKDKVKESNIDYTNKLLLSVKLFIKDNLDQSLSLKDVAEHFNYSANYLGHIFKKHENMRFSDYLLNQRMETAMKLIKTTNMKNYEISKCIGISNVGYFSKLFKEYYGKTPRECREIC